MGKDKGYTLIIIAIALLAVLFLSNSNSENNDISLITGRLSADIELMLNQTIQQKLASPCVNGQAKCFYKKSYACENKHWAEKETCSFDCWRGECVECYPWKDERGINLYQGSPNKCIGSDVFRCVAGKWEKAVSCEFGCKEQAISKTGGQETKEGHCTCFYGAPSICVGEELYECIGYTSPYTRESSYYYTKAGQCGNAPEWSKEIGRAEKCTQGQRKCSAARLWICNEFGYMAKTDESCTLY